MGDLAGHDGNVRPRIDRIAQLYQLAPAGFGISRLQERTVVAPHHALHEHRQLGPEPDRNAGTRDVGARLLAHERAAAGGQNLWAVAQQARDYSALAVAEVA